MAQKSSIKRRCSEIQKEAAGARYPTTTTRFIDSRKRNDSSRKIRLYGVYSGYSSALHLCDFMPGRRVQVPGRGHQYFDSPLSLAESQVSTPYQV